MTTRLHEVIEMDKPRISNGDATIIISKQAFADKAAECAAAMARQIGPMIIPVLSSLLAMITNELFEEEDNEGYDER